MLSVYCSNRIEANTGLAPTVPTRAHMTPSASPPPIPHSIAFIGGGNMARSLVGGLIAHGQPSDRIAVAEPQAELRAALTADFSVACGADGAVVAARAEVLVLAVKPQVMRAVCLELAPVLAQRRPLLLSIAAGVRTAQIACWIGAHLPVVRAMPNTPALIRAGVAGLYANELATGPERERAEEIMGATGSTVWVDDEDALDAVTAVSASGPAYCFLLMEAMEQAALDQGLAPAIARELSVQTALGAALMARASSEEPAQLRSRVTSPGGTTEAALEVLERSDFRALVANAVDAATKLARTLSHELDAT
jgi:pyrroline-5-carboxylate reductase